MEADLQSAIDNPTPWFSLLHYPSRAAWRSTDHLLGSPGIKSTLVDDTGMRRDVPTSTQPSPLSQTQFNLIQHSQRTNKQLKRTYKRIMETHNSFATKRERERRMAANFASQPKQHVGPAGYIEDTEGRHVGSWKERKMKPQSVLVCDDPSVSYILSMGMGRPTDRNVDPTAATVEDLNATNASGKPSGKLMASSSKDKPVGYCAEQTLTSFRYRFGPNCSITKRVLLEVQSLLGGKPPAVEGSASMRSTFQPKRVLDFGSGIGSSSAAALDVFGVSRSGTDTIVNGIDWIHSIDASQSMREATEKVLTSVLEGVPWGYDQQQLEKDIVDEELVHYEKILREIKGEDDEKALERRRRRLQKWEQSWQKLSNHRTRLTFGESLVDSSSFYSSQIDRDERPSLPWQQQLDDQRKKSQAKKQTSSQKGTFDLILCTYTLSELSSVSSSLTAAALLWEKLSPGGVMVFVEPGTPDGFSTLRSVRSMLLECSPPKEIRERRKREEKKILMDQIAKLDEDDAAIDILTASLEELEIGNNVVQDECHVIAPCTHNGSCPMSRHEKNHVKKNTRFGKYKSSAEDEDNDSTNQDDAAVDTSDEEEALMKELLKEDITQADLEEMLKLMESGMDEDDEGEDDDWGSDEQDTDDDVDFDAYYEVKDAAKSSKSVSSTMEETDVFDSAFCSFVHNFPGGTSRRKGEKFSYLVVQKRDSTNDDTSISRSSTAEDTLGNFDVVELLAKSIHHAQQIKEEVLQKGRHSGQYDTATSGTISHHEEQSQRVLQRAVAIEDEYLDSTIDKLGLELLHGDSRRKGWGRLIRAPLKRKGHVLIDYCSTGCSGCDGKPVGGTKGRIIRQKVSRGWSARVAPGCYSAARKARWGGLWPDTSERVKNIGRS
eukprot:g2546.t1 g2546   contig12:329845-332508(+)